MSSKPSEPLDPDEIAHRWPSTQWGEDEWYAALSADDGLYLSILDGIGKAVSQQRRRADQAGRRAEVRRLHRAGMSEGAISRRLAMGHEQVRRVLTTANDTAA